ncbi:MAG TPA: PIG-L family deacetylase [Bacteroidales bacterium]|nr:PIG-L family deacetylase [Bacteroidales bacterium]
MLFLINEEVSGQAVQKPQKCILVFGAHADDVDEIAGGTFAKYTSMGYKGVYVSVTNNLAGCNIERTPYFKGPRFTVSSSQLKYPADGLETNQIRSEEARQAASVYGADAVFLDFCEPEIYFGRKVIIYGTQDFLNFNPPGRRQINLATRYSEDVDVVVNLLEKYRPEIVIIHPLGGDKLDHEGSAYMMYLAFKKAMQKGIPVGKLWMYTGGWMLDEPARKHGRGKPDVRIEVKDFLKIKYKALDKHASQNGGFGREYVTENKTQEKEVVEEFITVIDNTK